MPSISNPTENLEGAHGVAVSLVDSISQHLKEAAVETADMWFDEFDHCTELFDELLEARTLERIVEIQTDYLQCCRRAFSEHFSRLYDLCIALGENMMTPIMGEHPAGTVSCQRAKGRAWGENEQRPLLRARRKEWSGVRKGHHARPPLPPYVAAEQ